MTITHTMTVPATVDRVADLLTSETYNMRMQTDREDVTDAKYAVQEDSDSTCRYRMDVVHYKRTKTGKLDKSVLENSTTHYTYDRRANRLDWRYEGPEGKRVDVHGVTLLTPQGDGTRVQREVEIQIKIPVVGRGLAKIVEGKFREGFVAIEGTIREMLQD
jgi:hypothetical protein